MQAGNLVPDTIVLDLISTELASKGWIQPPTNRRSRSEPPSSTSVNSTASQATSSPVCDAASFILDGFPRTAVQATSLEKLVPINFVVHLLTSPAIIASRIASRWVHAPSGRVYNTDFNPPKVPGKDDVTGETLTQRTDDSVETWKQRLKNFEESSKSLIEHYNHKGCLFRVEGNSSDEITPKLFAEVERRFA
jgi:adenylate kinase